MTKGTHMINHLSIAALPARIHAAPGAPAARGSDSRLPIGQAILIMLLASALLWSAIIAVGIRLIH